MSTGSTKKNYDSVSEKYRREGGGKLTKDEVEAYYVARMPATLAAVAKVLSEVKKRLQREINSVLDLGAGLGAGSLAAREIFPHATKFTLIESNEQMRAKGKDLFQGEWVGADVRTCAFAPHDLVLFSYSFGEIPQKERPQLLKKAWQAAQVLVVIEPGTPRGFEVVIEARDYLIQSQGSLLAPCPHANACPMPKGRWCHFSVRLPRSKEHRLAKGGQLGWEDEKFSYVAFGKEVGSDFSARLIGVPHKHPGHVVLPLCAKEGLVDVVVSKKEKDFYKQARKAHWGDAVD